MSSWDYRILIGKGWEIYFSVRFCCDRHEEDEDLPIIFGRPFPSTTHALVGILESNLTLRVEDEEITFGVNNKTRHKQAMSEVLCVNDIANVAENKEEVEDVNERE